MQSPPSSLSSAVTHTLGPCSPLSRCPQSEATLNLLQWGGWRGSRGQAAWREWHRWGGGPCASPSLRTLGPGQGSVHQAIIPQRSCQSQCLGGPGGAAEWGRTSGTVMRPGEAPVRVPAVRDTSLKATHSRGTLPPPSPLPSPRQEHLAVAGGGQERTTHGFPTFQSFSGHLLTPPPPAHGPSLPNRRSGRRGSRPRCSGPLLPP